jgi:uncharacterized protein DUF1207
MSIPDTLSGISDVTGVEVLRDKGPVARSAATTLVAETKQPPGKESLATGPLPEGHLFKPLLADPGWPHFSAVYHYYIDNPSGADIATVSFGETIPFYRNLAHEQSSAMGIGSSGRGLQRLRPQRSIARSRQRGLFWRPLLEFPCRPLVGLRPPLSREFSPR